LVERWREGWRRDKGERGRNGKGSKEWKGKRKEGREKSGEGEVDQGGYKLDNLSGSIPINIIIVTIL